LCRAQEVNQAVHISDLEWPNNINLLLAGRPEQTLLKIKAKIK
jgi:hypothetical protein